MTQKSIVKSCIVVRVFVAILSASMSLAVEAEPATATTCSGFYVTARQDDGFSVKVESNSIEIVYADYSPASLMRYTRDRKGSLTFHIDQGGPSRLRCDATGAIIDIAASDTYLHNPEAAFHNPARRVRLVRFSGDIWKYAKHRRWAIGD